MYIMFQYFSKNGKIYPIDKSFIPLSNIEYQYGFGVYETIRVSNKTINFIKNHSARLINSAKIINLEHPFTATQVENFIKKLVESITISSFNIKILLIGSPQKENVQLFVIPLNPLFPDKKLYKKGCSLITTHHERIFPNAKTLNMLQSYMAYKKATESNCYDALLINNTENITEGTRTNFFIVKNNKIYTAKEKDVLVGVTRKAVMHTAQKNNIDITETDIKQSGLQSCDGAFLTSTSSKIIPITQIDSIKFEIPKLTKKLMVFFNEFLKESKGVLPE